MPRKFATEGQLEFLKWVHQNHNHRLCNTDSMMLSKVIDGEGYVIFVTGRHAFRQSFLNDLRTDYLDVYIQSNKFNKN